MSFYTYLHVRPDTQKVFYVGKGKDRRAYSSSGRNKHWRNIVAKCGREVQIAATWPTETDALLHERFLIQCFRDLGHALVNASDGGEAGPVGFKHSAEAKQKISAASKRFRPGGKLGPQSKEHIESRVAKLRGRVRSAEEREAISAAKTGRSNGREGYRHSPETIAKIKANSVGWKHTPEQIEKMKQAWVRRKAKMAGASA